MLPAILFERDYKGHYERFALTPEEFRQQFGTWFKDMPEPSEIGASYTLSGMVHIWYRTAIVGDPEWNRFFTDMTYGLPQSDINTENLAYIREDFFQSLRKHLPASPLAGTQVQPHQQAKTHLSSVEKQIHSASCRTGLSNCAENKDAKVPEPKHKNIPLVR